MPLEKNNEKQLTGLTDFDIIELFQNCVKVVFVVIHVKMTMTVDETRVLGEHGK